MQEQSNITAADIAARYPHRKDGSGFRIPCPVHGGEDANCYIGPGDYGSIEAKCWSHGCKWADIMQALDVPLSGKGRNFVAAYQHNDGNNRNVYRIDKPDGNKDISGAGSVKGTKLLAWGNDDGKATLVIVEGEKSAAAFQAFGLPKHLAVFISGRLAICGSF